MEMGLARTERWDRGGGMDTGKIVVVEVKDLGQFWLGISTLKMLLPPCRDSISNFQ